MSKLTENLVSAFQEGYVTGFKECLNILLEFQGKDKTLTEINYDLINIYINLLKECEE